MDFTMVESASDNMFCPACGDAILEKLHEEETPCSHLLYVTGIEEAFLYLRADYEKAFNRFQKSSYEDYVMIGSGLEKFILGEFKSNSHLHIGSSIQGMACGPISYTIYFGFDFNASNEVESQESS